MIGVLDSSAAIRLFIPDGPIPDELEVFMRRVEQGENLLIAPELLLAEMANVINKKRRAGFLTPAECDELLADMLDLPVRLYSHREFLASAFELAVESGLTVYDALFPALALRYDARLFTADNALRKVADGFGLS
jgi:predicted nucleic acid-binding protein